MQALYRQKQLRGGKGPAYKSLLGKRHVTSINALYSLDAHHYSKLFCTSVCLVGMLAHGCCMDALAWDSHTSKNWQDHNRVQMAAESNRLTFGVSRRLGLPGVCLRSKCGGWRRARLTQRVFWFQISVDDIVAMAVVHGNCELHAITLVG